MQDNHNSYKIVESSSMLHEPLAAYALHSQPSKRRVSTQDLIAEGCMTLAQSKAMIKEKIYNHFHKE